VEQRCSLIDDFLGAFPRHDLLLSPIRGSVVIATLLSCQFFKAELRVIERWALRSRVRRHDTDRQLALAHRRFHHSVRVVWRSSSRGLDSEHTRNLITTLLLLNGRFWIWEHPLVSWSHIVIFLILSFALSDLTCKAKASRKARLIENYVLFNIHLWRFFLCCGIFFISLCELVIFFLGPVVSCISEKSIVVVFVGTLSHSSWASLQLAGPRWVVHIERRLFGRLVIGLAIDIFTCLVTTNWVVWFMKVATSKCHSRFSVTSAWLDRWKNHWPEYVAKLVISSRADLSSTV